jgi:hypothetical protein
MIKHALNYVDAVERLVVECCAVLIIGIGGAGRVGGRTAFRTTRALFGAENPHVGLVEFDLTQKTGRQDTNLVTPSTPGRLIVHIVQAVSGAAIVARFVKDSPQTDHLGGCAVPESAGLAIEVHEQAMAELSVQVGQLADRLREPQPGWRCNGAGAVGSNDIRVTELLCRNIKGNFRVLSAGLLIAENGRVPRRIESVALEGTHMVLVRNVARRPPCR